MNASDSSVTVPSPDSPEAMRPPLPSPRRTGTFGMMIFLASLFMLFAASMLGYVIIRLQLMNDGGPNPPLGEVRLPTMLWLSTFVILISSLALHFAGINVQRERQLNFRRAITITCILGYMFLLIQGPALYDLIESQSKLAETNSALYGLIFFLILVHGLHVVGGLIPLTVITARAHKGRYDHEHHYPVVHMALYWHFLDVVWVVMFSLMMVLR